MSNIIKSFRVIKSNEPFKKNTDMKSNSINMEVIEDAKKKTDAIVKAAERKAVEIIESAHMEYEKQLSNAYEKAKSIFEENKEKGYAEGFKLGEEKGYSEGYEKGYLESKKESQNLISEALEIKNSYISMRDKLLKETEKDLIELVVTIYEKVLYQKVEEDEKYIISLILSGIEELEIKEKLTIIVSKYDYEILKEHEQIILAKASLIDSIDIRLNSDMEKGDCILETSKGNIDVSLNNQISEIKELLYTILNNE